MHSPVRTFFGSLIGVLLLGACAATLAGDPDTTDVLTFDGDRVVGRSELVRNGDHVLAFFDSAGLEPGETTTLWWVVFNYPEHCSDGACGADDFDNPMVAASQLWAAGSVTDAGGANRYAARLVMDDRSRAEFGPGLVDPAHAEVHLVVRSHGPALEGALHEQLNSLNGGCPPNDCVNLQYALHFGQGAQP